MNEKILVFGGTGFLGQALSEKLLSLNYDVCVYSRSEDKHRQIRLKYPKIKSIIGDVRDYDACFSAINSLTPSVILFLGSSPSKTISDSCLSALPTTSL